MSLFSKSELKTTNKAFVFSHCAYILCFLQTIELDRGHGCLIFYRLFVKCKARLCFRLMQRRCPPRQWVKRERFTYTIFFMLSGP